MRLLRDLMASMKAKFGRIRDAVRAEYVPAQKPPVPYWTAYGFVRWRNNPNWPGRRAAAARRTAGKTRRMR